MAKITHLPDDVVAVILKNESISVEDIGNFQSTCKRFQQITLPKKLWERKYYQRCCTAEKRYSREKQEKIFYHTDFKEIIKAGLYCVQKLQQYAFVISENKLRYTDKKQLEHLLRSTAENPMTCYFVWDEINRISAQKSRQMFSNLICDYFKLFSNYLKLYRFIHKQNKYMNMSETKLLLEKQLTIVAQYFQPRVSYSAVKMWLDGITERVLSRVKNKYPVHSICSATLQQFSFWRDNNIMDNFWNEIESRQIMCVLEEYIFSMLNIYEFHDLLMILNLDAKHMKYITGSSLSYLLTVTYHIVARRLGIHSILRGTYNEERIEVVWKPKYKIDNWYNAEVFYMDNYLSYHTFRSIPRRRNLFITHIYNLSLNYMTITEQIMDKMEETLSISCNSSSCDEFPTWEFKFLNYLFQRYLHCNVKEIHIEIEHKNITNTIEIIYSGIGNRLNRRTKKIKFAVGMIVTHTSYGRSCRNADGVIIEWHYHCDKMFPDKLKNPIKFPHLSELDKHKHICNCENFSDDYYQPHYVILTENDIICYEQQDYLWIRPPRRINNREIETYFSSFEGTHYVPNENLRQNYPEDTAAIAEILASTEKKNTVESKKKSH